MRYVALFICIVFTLGKIYLYEDFNSTWKQRWTTSLKNTANFTLATTPWNHHYPELNALRFDGNKTHGAITHAFTPFTNANHTLYIQFIAAIPQNSHNVAAFIKLLPKGFNQSSFGFNSPYLVLFGPSFQEKEESLDKVLKLILSYKGNNFDWKQKPQVPDNKIFNLYTFELNPDNRYRVTIDKLPLKTRHTLYEDWNILLPKYIRDPQAVKPPEWDDRENIEENYTVSEFIEDINTSKPLDWNVSIDGEYKPRMISNPKFIPAGQRNKFDNPNYKGQWQAPLIVNPDYNPDASIYMMNDIGGVAIDVYQEIEGTMIGKVQITDDELEAERFEWEWSKHVDRERLRLREYKQLHKELYHDDMNTHIVTKEDL